jgi:hypothetical protein
VLLDKYSQLVRGKESSHETEQESRHALDRHLADLNGVDTAAEPQFFGTRHAHGHSRNRSGRFDPLGAIGRKDIGTGLAIEETDFSRLAPSSLSNNDLVLRGDEVYG